MHFKRPVFSLTFVFTLATAATAAPLLYDMGTSKSAVWPGTTPVTTDSAYSDKTTFGWNNRTGLKGIVRAYTELVNNKSRGTSEPPPIWTNPITEDAVVGDRETSFLIKAAPGDYQIYLVCGASDYSRSQYWDFEVKIGSQKQRVQMEGSQQFRSLRFRAKVDQEPLAITFTPRSKWLVNAILAWTDAEASQVEKDLITPFEEWTYRMPPQEWAKWKADPDPDSGTLPPLTLADQKRGYAVYNRHYLECIYPHTKPRAEDLSAPIRMFATLDEYEPANVVLHPLKDLGGLKVKAGAIGPVPATNIDVRRVRFLRARPNYTTMHRYRIVPDVLEHFDTLDLKAGENTRLWFTVRVPKEAPAGTFTGKVTFTSGTSSFDLPITLRILPIRLRDDPGMIFGIYYRHPYDLMINAPDEVSKQYFRRRAELEHADMVAHGTRNVVLSLWSPPANAQGEFKFDWDLLAEKIALWRKYNFQGPIVMGINSGGVYANYMKESPGSHLRGVKDPPEEFSREMTAMVKAIEAERQKRGWPEFLYYPVDEPSTAPDSVNFMVKVLKACKAAGVRTYVTADPTHEQFEPMRPYIDVWCTQPFAPDRDTVLADTKARHVEYWCYPNHVNGENDHTPVTGARMTYGFGFWRSGFRTLIPWIYSSSSGDPFNYLDGPYMDFFNRTAPDGTPIPVAMWEAYREGYDDYRYIYTLEQLVGEAKRSSKAKTRQAAVTAEKELQSVWNAIRVQPKYKHDDLWAPEEFDAYRWVIARQILALQELTKAR